MTAAPLDMFLFVNPRSGGNRGQDFLDAPQPLLVDTDTQQISLHIFNLLDGEPGKKTGFLKLRQVLQRQSVARVVVGGGDGTVMWVESEAAKHGVDTQRQVLFGIVPLGTGNDFSRVAGWGGKNPSGFLDKSCEGLRKMVRSWAAATPRPHDVWQVTLNVCESRGEILHIDSEQEEVPIDCEATRLSLPMINYFSMGQESKVGIEFDKHRTKNQVCNLLVYACEGLFTELKCCETQHIGHFVAGLHLGTSASGPVIMDSRGDSTLPEVVGSPESLMFLNINSYAGGSAHFWQPDAPLGVDPEPKPESVDVPSDPGDGKLEVITLPSIVNIPLDRLQHHARRVHSGAPYYLEFFEDDDRLDAYCEVDGEFYHLVNPESISVSLLKRLQVLQKPGSSV